MILVEVDKMKTIQEYMEAINPVQKEDFKYLFETVSQAIPTGFEARIQYNMITWVVPLSMYPKGYLNDTTVPLPFISIAAQKNYISLYHMGLLANKPLLTWFENEYAKQVTTKLNMGKSCIRFKNKMKIPFDLVSQLVSKMQPKEWITLYEQAKRK